MAVRISRPLDVSDEVFVEAAPMVVWAVVADPTRIPDFSPENIGATSPHSGPLTVGERFVGHNRRGPARWSTGCVVTQSIPGESFAFRVHRYGTSKARFPVRVATWSYTFEAVHDGTRVVETWHDDRRWPDALARRFDGLATGGKTFAEFQQGNIRRSLDRLATIAVSGDDVKAAQ